MKRNPRPGEHLIRSDEPRVTSCVLCGADFIAVPQMWRRENYNAKKAKWEGTYRRQWELKAWCGCRKEST